MKRPLKIGRTAFGGRPGGASLPTPFGGFTGAAWLLASPAL